MFNAEIPPPLITREHGSWAVLIIPMLVSLAVVGRWKGDFAWVVLSAFGVFLSYVPAQLLLRHYTGSVQRVEKLYQAKVWGAVYAIVSLGFASVLLLKGYVFLLAIGAAGILSFIANFYLAKEYSKSIFTDLIAVAGLALSGPSAYYVLAGEIDRRAVSLYILNVLFFGCSVFYVHMKIRASATKKREMGWRERLSLGKINLLYYVAVATIVEILAALHCTPIIVLVAFVPIIVQGLYGTINLSSNVRFRNLGLILLGQSIVFGMMLSGSM
jgi:hypothetical protein